MPAGAPYPARLAAMLGKPVVNLGVGGDRAYEVRGRVGSALARKPGFLLVLVGSNDGTHGADPAVVKDHLRAVVQAAKNNKTVPVLATPPPMAHGWHELYAGNTRAIAAAIRAVASEERVALVDLERRFGKADGLLQSDGLHPTDAGVQLIADSFYSVLK
jgi:lysophospholipase L1-like esterase